MQCLREQLILLRAPKINLCIRTFNKEACNILLEFVQWFNLIFFIEESCLFGMYVQRDNKLEINFFCFITNSVAGLLVTYEKGCLLHKVKLDLHVVKVKNCTPVTSEFNWELYTIISVYLRKKVCPKEAKSP